jgi:hypothetical protein
VTRFLSIISRILLDLSSSKNRALFFGISRESPMIQVIESVVRNVEYELRRRKK